MDIKVTVTVEGLSELSSSISLLASAIGYGKGAAQLVEMAKATEQIKSTEVQKVDKPKITQKDVKKSEPTPPEESADAPEETASEPDSLPETQGAKTYKLEDVRAKLADLSRAGKSAEVKQIISLFNAEKLSDVDPSNYAELMAKAEAL